MRTNRAPLMRRYLLALAIATTLAGFSAAAEQAPTHLDLGLRFSFMPTGRFSLEYSDNHIGTVHSAPTIMALGFGAFADYSFNSYLAAGFGGEAVLNVIPDVPHYDVGQMLNLGARLKFTYPLGSRFRIYGVLTPGFGVIFASLARPLGFTLTTTVGGAFRISRRNSAFVEIGYMAGFQRRTDHQVNEPYGPSYLVTSCGWQLSL